MKILAIETSCDETAIALVEASGGLAAPKFRIAKNLVASQIKIHRPFGGIVPNLAKREHIKNLPILFNKIFRISILGSRTSLILRKSDFLNIDLIAVTIGPGLEPCLWTGITFAKQMYADLRGLQRGFTRRKEVELIGVNHLEAHLYSFLLTLQAKPCDISCDRRKCHNYKKYRTCPPAERGCSLKDFFPAVGLIISGGHTILLLIKDLIHYKKLGETRDDAIGEAFDKVARLLNLPYPGGPEIEKLAIYGNPTSIDFPRPMINQKNYDFSFSGLKTSVLYYLRDLQRKQKNQRIQGVDAEQRGLVRETMRKLSTSISQNQRQSATAADIAAAFQAASFDVIISKTLRAAKEFKAKSILISGGVASNFSLKKNLKLKIKNEKLKINLIVPSKKFCLDNATMVAAASYINFLQNKKRRLIAQSNLNL